MFGVELATVIKQILDLLQAKTCLLVDLLQVFRLHQGMVGPVICVVVYQDGHIDLLVVLIEIVQMLLVKLHKQQVGQDRIGAYDEHIG